MSIRDQRIVIFSITTFYYIMLLVVENIDESALNKITTYYIIRLSLLVLGCQLFY